MPSPFKNFPVTATVDVLISYIQHLFKTPEITPTEYRWDGTNDREDRIRISAPFSIDNEKPLSAPFIVVERGTFTFANRIIDNQRSATANTFENSEKVDWMDGIVNVTVGAGVASEASNIAGFLAVMFQADRHAIKKTSKFIRNLNYIDISPEMPVIKDVEVRRWEVTLRLNVSVQIGWLKKELEPVLWKSAAIYSIKAPSEVFSNQGIISSGEGTLTDASKSFGFSETNDPQLIQQEFDRKYYYIRFKDDPTCFLHPIVEIVDENTIRLETHDENNNPVPWVSTETKTDVEYDLLWNSLHIYMELPKEES